MVDIRLHVSFPGHYKTLRLKGVLGPGAVLALLELWCWAAQNRSKGDLSGMGPVEIAAAARWPGDPAEFVKALLDCGWLDAPSNAGSNADGMIGHLELHDWTEHQAYVIHSDDRRARASHAAKIRWEREFAARRNAERMPTAMLSSSSSPLGEEEERAAGASKAPSAHLPKITKRTKPADRSPIARQGILDAIRHLDLASAVREEIIDYSPLDSASLEAAVGVAADPPALFHVAAPWLLNSEADE